jgi:hypothetical protein
MFRTDPLSIIRSLVLYTQLASGIKIPRASSQHNLYDIPIAVYTVLDS